MNLHRVASIFASVAVVVAAAPVFAGSPNYGNVLHQAQEARSACVEALPITFSVPGGGIYQTLRAGIYNRFNYMKDLANKTALLTPSGDSKRAEMLSYAQKLKTESQVVENMIKQLKDLADNADDHSTEQKANELRHLINKVQGKAHVLVKQLD